MTSSEFFDQHIDAVYVTETAANSRAGRRAASRAGRIVSTVGEIRSRNFVPPEHRNRRTIVIDTHRGKPFGRCPGSKGHRCCNYRTVDVYIGCSIGCTYCIMNGYLNYAPMVVQADVEAVIDEIRAATSESTIRVGSGEVGDSLLLDPVFRLNEEIIRGLSDLPNVTFEMKSKTNYVDHLLEIETKGQAVVAFSLNPPAIVAAEEGLAASPDERLEAAMRCVESGYRTAFHFDPIIKTDSFPDDYLSLISRLASFKAGSVAWVSLGTLRFPPSLKDSLSTRPYAREEFVPSADGKLRYLQRVRREMYRTMMEALTAVTDAPVYLCMESAAMWRYVAGKVPEDVESLVSVFR